MCVMLPRIYDTQGWLTSGSAEHMQNSSANVEMHLYPTGIPTFRKIVFCINHLIPSDWYFVVSGNMV